MLTVEISVALLPKEGRARRFRDQDLLQYVNAIVRNRVMAPAFGEAGMAWTTVVSITLGPP